MNRRFTPSQDGQPRAEIRASVRLTAEQLAHIEAAADYEDMPVQRWLAHALHDGMHAAINRYEDDRAIDRERDEFRERALAEASQEQVL